MKVANVDIDMSQNDMTYFKLHVEIYRDIYH